MVRGSNSIIQIHSPSLRDWGATRYVLVIRSHTQRVRPVIVVIYVHFQITQSGQVTSLALIIWVLPLNV